MWLGLVLPAGATAGLGAGLAFAWLRARTFGARIAALRREVLGVSTEAHRTPALPEIVRAYALRAGGRFHGPGTVHLTHRALLATDIRRPAISIDADQWLSCYSSRLVWHGRGAMFGLPVSVVDSFVAGRGLLEARLAGTVRVAHGSGLAIDKGELQRYLSELPLHPDAILNNGALHWSQRDERTVEVTGTTATGTASLQLSFDAAGDIVGSLAPDRPMTVGKGTVPTRWRGSFGNYRQFGAYRIPSHGEVSWDLPEGPFTYWRGEITSYETLPQDSRLPPDQKT